MCWAPWSTCIWGAVVASIAASGDALVGDFDGSSAFRRRFFLGRSSMVEEVPVEGVTVLGAIRGGGGIMAVVTSCRGTSHVYGFALSPS